MDRRRVAEWIARALMAASVATVLAVLVLIIGTVVVRGIPAMSWAMIGQTPRGGFYLGREGGILNAILGSLAITGGATVLALSWSLPVVLCLNAYLPRRSPLASAARFALDVLWGIPSIVYGAFGFVVMLWFGIGASLLGGVIAVALLIFPIMARAMDEVVRTVPQELTDASYAMGATRLETSTKVVVRQALPGIVTAVLIAMGRGIGDAASVLFTAGFTDAIPVSPFRPAATLPLAIFFQLGTPFPEVQARAYASALVLTALILAISAAARLFGRRYSRHVVR
jgi:phosphate transport system permease protein